MKRLTLPDMPDCWETCGACSDGSLLVSDVFVAAGDELQPGEPLIELETDKTTLEIPTPCQGTVVEVKVEIGDEMDQSSIILTYQ